jgi:hypothetical protein
MLPHAETKAPQPVQVAAPFDYGNWLPGTLSNVAVVVWLVVVLSYFS